MPLPDHDPSSNAYARWAAYVERSGGRAWEYALLGDCAKAIEAAQQIVTDDTVAGNQYLRSGRDYENVFSVLSWCDVPQAAEWVAWGKRHLGEPDGGVEDSIWWSRRWARDNPANNYYHSFVMATSYYAMATGDERWLAFLRDDRLPLMHAYYATTPEGGSREGTGYGESHRTVLHIARLWREYDGTAVLPQAFIDNTIRFWTHAITPGQQSIALFGDQTRAKGRTDGYHCDIFDNALQLATEPEAIAMARWMLSRINCASSGVFLRLILRDYPEVPRPPMPVDYHAPGAGVLFVRESWEEDAAFLYFTAGLRDEAHQCEDQGAFAVWDNGQWQTVGDHPWTRNGTCSVKPVDGARFATQNVVRFPGLERNVRDAAGELAYTLDSGVLSVNMDLTKTVGRRWLRRVLWTLREDSMRVMDTFDGDAYFGFERPDDSDDNAPYQSKALVIIDRTATGFFAVVRW